MVEQRPLGSTGLLVSEVGFGAWGVGGSLWGDPNDASSTDALIRAFDLGINFVDTALAYGKGHSERLIGRVLSGRKDRVYVATKIPPKNWLWPARPGVPLRKVFPMSYVKSCTEQSLKNLQRDYVDLQQFHVWNPEWVEDDDWRKSVEWLKRSGKARFVGISVNDHQPSSVLTALNTGLIDSVQVIYNIFDQTPAEELFPICRHKKVGVIARVPFDEGGLTGSITPQTIFPPNDMRSHYFAGDRKRELCERVEAIRRDLGDSEPLTDTALRFCLSHPAVSVVIPGMRQVHHVEANAKASAAGPLPPEVLQTLGRHQWRRSFYP